MTLQAMYPALVNSPFTELAQAIDHEQTTIEVLDGSKLPDAPNIATIGMGEDAETILYAQKDGNVLSGVTRGFQAMPKAWGQGTSVARMFTAYDYDALRINLQNTKQELDDTKEELGEHLADNLRHVTQAERTKWNNGQLYKITLDDGRANPLANGTDLNTIDYTGVFRVGYSSDTNGLLAGTYFVIVFRGAPASPYTIMQIAINENTNQGQMYIRTQTASGTWSAWRTVIDNNVIMSGAGSPEGVVTAPVGTLYRRTDGGSSTTLYVKESGTGNTGWKAVQTA